MSTVLVDGRHLKSVYFKWAYPFFLKVSGPPGRLTGRTVHVMSEMAGVYRVEKLFQEREREKKKISQQRMRGESKLNRDQPLQTVSNPTSVPAETLIPSTAWDVDLPS